MIDSRIFCISRLLCVAKNSGELCSELQFIGDISQLVTNAFDLCGEDKLLEICVMSELGLQISRCLIGQLRSVRVTSSDIFNDGGQYGFYLSIACFGCVDAGRNSSL